ncbi:Tripartite tricarboxylate transporter TctB family protein [Yoonia tamlensis]|uniref:Tripartite tricarboxylate transporter TctB family protein n=1 Tax=Yoonia tamlensis TaxID=390270 RepID=A0A1I6GZK5_9RHOB|nr:tripartite tricarboxylate transporter TctB family protein [Yoonia tamlensis]SFR47599.1 Tripartite tricarboxylate transporter TctB family protein [Yoonia tamlensis]
MRHSGLVLPAILGFIFAICLAEILRYRWEVALAPGLACGIGLVLCVVLVVQNARARAPRPSAANFGKGDIAQFSWLALAAFLVTMLGFAIGGALSVFVQVLVVRQGKYRIITAAICAAAVPIIVIGVFQELLQIRLYAGHLLR